MGRDFAEGSPGMGAGFSSRHGALCALPTADSAQNPGQAGACSARPCAGHTHTEHTFASQSQLRTTPQRSPCLLLPALRAPLRDRSAAADWLRRCAGGGAAPGDWLRGCAGGRGRVGDWLRRPAGGGAAPFPCRPVRAPPGRGSSARPCPGRGARCSLRVSAVSMCFSISARSAARRPRLSPLTSRGFRAALTGKPRW